MFMDKNNDKILVSNGNLLVSSVTMEISELMLTYVSMVTDNSQEWFFIAKLIADQC